MVKAASQPRDRTMPECVLVVEDDTVLALSMEQTLIEAGVKSVYSCASTEEAVNHLREKRPDAVIIDIHLADADDGYVIAEIVSLLSPRSPRIVFSTGSPKEIPASVAKLGKILEKPYQPEDLLAAIEGKPKGILKRLISSSI